MKRSFPVLLVFLSMAAAFAADTPPELTAAKARYKAALADGNKSAREEYLHELQRMKSSVKPKKNRALADAIDAELKTLSSEPAPKAQKGDSLPTGKAVPGRPGFVTSPYEPYKGFIDVHGIAPGAQVICPYSLKPFLVPAAAAGQ